MPDECVESRDKYDLSVHLRGLVRWSLSSPVEVSLVYEVATHGLGRKVVEGISWGVCSIEQFC